MTVRGKAFLLRPDTPKEGQRREVGPEGTEMREPLKSYAQEAGLVMHRSALVPNTMYALEATEYAQEQGQFDAFHRAAYRAYWEHGKDLGDLAVIRELAEGCGLNWPQLEERLNSGYYRRAVLQQYQQAIDIGIQGVPAFLMGNVLFTGAQPYQIFQLAMKQAQGTE